MKLRALALVLLSSAIAGWPGLARAQCGGTQLCPPGTGDCTVAANCTITVPADGLSIDLGARRLVITRTLTVAGPAGAGVTITAGSFLLDGGTILALGADNTAGAVAIFAAADITVRNNALIDVSAAGSAGLVDLQALGGDLSFSGRIRATSTTRDGFGGDVTLFAAGSATVGGSSIDVSGGDRGGSGSLSIDAEGGSLFVSAPLNASGGEGGDISLGAATTLQTTSAATMKIGATRDAGSGGSLDISAGGDVTVGGESTGNGSPAASSEDGQSGGDGGEVTVFSETGNVTINGRIEMIGAAGGTGGALDLTAGQNLTFSRPLVATATGDGSRGGDVLLFAGGTLSMPQQVDIRGGTGSGGTIDATAEGGLTVSASLLATGTQLGGTILLAGCSVNVTSQGSLNSQGPGGDLAGANVLQTRSSMTIAGPLRATAQNVLVYRSPPPPSVLPGVTVQPAATVLSDPTLPCCVNCPVTTTTTTSSTTNPVAVCGDGVVGGAEQCDDGNLVAGDCCSPLCRFEAAGSSCPNDGNPCTLDVCNATGICTHPAGNAGTVCRSAAGVCDLVESCNGTSPVCPPDVKSTAVCRVATGACDAAERCTGASDTCPPDTAAPAGTTCREPAGPCDAAETCDGTSKSCPADAKRTGVCRPSSGPCDLEERCPGTSDACPADVVRPDGTPCGADACSTGAVCSAGVCGGGSGGPAGCAPCETCDPATGACVAAPRPLCARPVVPGKARLSMRKSLRGPGSDLVVWKWLNGAATAASDFADPLSTDGVTFCVYDRSQPAARLLFRADVPAGGTCGSKPCWSSAGARGFKFAAAGGNASGITSVKLTAGAAGRAKILLKGKGVHLTDRPFGLPRPSLPVPLTAQLQSDGGACWEASYARSGLRRNDGEQFSGVAD